MDEQREIGRGSGVSDRADGDEIGSGFGEGAEIGEIDAAGKLNRAARVEFTGEANEASGFGWREVVQQEGIGAGGESFAELGFVANLDLHGQGRRRRRGEGFVRDRFAGAAGQSENMFMGAAKGFGDAAGERDVVFLDEESVVQAETMIHSATQADRIFFKLAEQRQGFAGVADADGGSGDGFDETAGGGGDAGKMREEIQRGALGGKNRAGAAGKTHNLSVGGHGGAFGKLRLETELRIKRQKYTLRQRHAGENQFLTGKDDGRGDVVRGGNGGGGVVAGKLEQAGVEVFLKSTADERTNRGRVPVGFGVGDSLSHRNGQGKDTTLPGRNPTEKKICGARGGGAEQERGRR